MIYLLYLQKIPQGDWFCQKCVPIVKHEVEDEEPEEKALVINYYIVTCLHS